jgi:hypothetical protein
VSYEERGPLVHGPGDARQFIGDCDNHLVARCTLREPMHHLSMLNDPDQVTSRCDGPDGLIVSEAREQPTIDKLEKWSLLAWLRHWQAD